NAMCEHPELLKQYVTQNPNGLSKEHLEIVSSWQTFVRGRFFIERLLKQYAAFIYEDNTVYGVSALGTPFEEMIPKQALPLAVETVLIPFRELIVYDGLFSSYPIFFGSNMSANMKDTYMRAKRKGEIVLSLDKQVQKAAAKKMKKPLKDWKPLLNQLADEAKSLRAQSGSPPTWSPAFSLVKASIELAQTAVNDPDNVDELWRLYERLDRQLGRLEDGMHRL
ncbi:MAG: hypothetical protein KDE51_20815, partial [Anaerolineales bacterium]|nr:hypothetical protein [Anaerolineales bacterium]